MCDIQKLWRKDQKSCPDFSVFFKSCYWRVIKVVGLKTSLHLENMGEFGGENKKEAWSNTLYAV